MKRVTLAVHILYDENITSAHDVKMLADRAIDHSSVLSGLVVGAFEVVEEGEGPNEIRNH